MTMKKLSITREFPATIDQIWDAFTIVEKLKSWWSPKTMNCSHMTVDLRVNGMFHYCFEGKDASQYWGRGVYKVLEKPTRIVYLDTFTDKDGTPIPPSSFGLPGDEVAETPVDIQFSPIGNRTKMEIIMDNPFDEEMTAEMTQGWNEMFDKLEDSFKTVKT